MPKMQVRLAAIIKNEFSPRRPELVRLLNSNYYDAIMEAYQDLGGDFTNFPPQIGAYDISTESFDIELDEYLHYNRYRQSTLESPIYIMLPQFPLELYCAWCAPGQEAEIKCLHAGSHGGKWSTPSSERQFGISNAPGDLSGSGSSRWKQRAFNDYRKDVLSLVINRPLVRISVYDKIGDYTVEQILDSPNYMDFAPQVIAFVESRLPSM